MLWKIKKQPKKQDLESLKAEMPSLSEDALTLLLNRNINSLEAAKTFFNPDKAQIHDPFLMKDMDKAVELLTEIFSSQGKILLYGDYDVDGTSSVSLCYLFLTSIGANVSYYIPDRYGEGYGVSEQGVDFIIENKIDLVITLDCGIRAEKQINRIVEANIPVIICDHHEQGDVLPKASAVLDPKRKDCNYPFKELCGCGVAFKLLHGFCLQQGIELEKLFQYLDLVAVATCADIVPIVGENRVLVHYGIEKINTSPSLGLATLKKKAGLDGILNVRALVFGFAPRINAAGRINHASGAVDLLITKDIAKANEFADAVEAYNQERRIIDKSITEEALAILEHNLLDKGKKTTVLSDPNWHKGVIGIVASRCIESYFRPTIIFKETDGIHTGSARSVGDFDILKAITKCEHLLDKFGGHKFAAGLSLKKENYSAFCDLFEKTVAETISESDTQEVLLITQELSIDRINFNFYHLLERLEPFGPQNMQPVFISKNIKPCSTPTLLKDLHLKFQIAGANKQKIDCIGFNMVEEFKLVSNNTPFDIAYTIEINEFRGEKKLQLMLKGVRTHNPEK